MSNEVAGELFSINSRKFDGSISRTWCARSITSEAADIAFVGVFENTVEHLDLGSIVEGTRSYEYFWLERWYSCFEFFEPTGEFRNAYFNINMPPIISQKAVDYVDLDIDVIAWPDRTFAVLDEAEFRENTQLLGYPPNIVSKVLASVAIVVEIVRNSRFPLFTKNN